MIETEVKPKLKRYYEAREEFANAARKEIRKTFWTSMTTGKLWFVNEVYQEKGFFGRVKVDLEDTTVTFSRWQKFLHNGQIHPHVRIDLEEFLTQVEELQLRKEENVKDYNYGNEAI